MLSCGVVGVLRRVRKTSDFAYIRTMKGLIKFTPAIPLSEFIDYIYIDLHPDGPESLKEHIQPTHPRLVVYRAPAKGTSEAEMRGVFNSPLKAGPAVFDGSIGVRFKPYGLFAGFGIRGDSIANQSVPASGFFAPEEEQQLDGILHEPNPATLVQTVHDALFRKLDPHAVLFEISDMVDELVKSNLAKNTQKNLAAAFERTPKSFIALFKKAVGITPLEYLHIHKIEAARALIRNRPELTLTEIAYETGFYDQAHFIRVFRTHTGMAPTRYKANPSEVNFVQVMGRSIL